MAKKSKKKNRPKPAVPSEFDAETRAYLADAPKVDLKKLSVRNRAGAALAGLEGLDEDDYAAVLDGTADLYDRFAKLIGPEFEAWLDAVPVADQDIVLLAYAAETLQGLGKG